MDLHSLLELLKLLWLIFEVVRYFINRQKKKALAETVKEINQRLLLLEKSIPEKSEID